MFDKFKGIGFELIDIHMLRKSEMENIGLLLKIQMSERFRSKLISLSFVKKLTEK